MKTNEKIITFLDLKDELDLVVEMVDDLRRAFGMPSVFPEVRQQQMDAQGEIEPKEPKLN